MHKAGIYSSRAVVNLVIDGRHNIPKDVFNYLKYDLKMWDPGMLLSVHKGSEVTCHIFERTVELPRHPSQREYYLPMQMILSVKEKTGGVLNSHLWSLTAFARQVVPKYLLILGPGVYPDADSFRHLYEEMELYPQVGLCSGEVKPYSPKFHTFSQASQVFDHKLSHILQKQADSFSGFVVPFTSNFTLYRWHAIQGEPLNQYFRVEEDGLAKLGPFYSNLYLSVDRIIAFEVLTKARENWTTHYASSAVAEQSLPGSLIDLIVHRRRQLSGTLLGYFYYLSKMTTIWNRSAHSLPRKLALTLQSLMHVFYALYIWFAPALMYLVMFYIFQTSVAGLGFGTDIITFGFHLIYLITIGLQIVFAMASRTEDVERVYLLSSLIYGSFMYVAFALFLVSSSEGSFNSLFITGLGIGFGILVVAAIINNCFFTMAFSFFQYLFTFPTYVNLFLVYSFCNLHDISSRIKEGSLNVLLHQARQEIRKNIDVKVDENPKRRASEILQEVEHRIKELQHAQFYADDNPTAPSEDAPKRDSVPRDEKRNVQRTNFDARQMLDDAYVAAQKEAIDRKIEE